MSKITLILLITAFLSCSKQQAEKATNHNITLHFSGQVLDINTGYGIANVPVTATGYIAERSMGTGCFDPSPAAATTNGYGYFDLSVTTDSLYFYQKGISLRADPNDDYAPMDSRQILETPTQDLSNIQFIFFPRAGLIVSHVHTSADSVAALHIDVNVNSVWYSLNCPLFDDPTPLDSAFFDAVANRYTKIRWKTTYASGDTKDFLDSIKCLPNHDNGYVVRY